MDHSNLSSACARYAAHCADGGTALPGLTALSRSTVSDIESYVYEPVLCLVLQGAKTVVSGTHDVHLQAGDALVVSHDLTVLSRITQASPREPYLALVLALDLDLLRSLAGLADIAAADADLPRALATDRADSDWLGPLGRYMAMADDPLDLRVLGPAVLREIHYRLLISPLGAMLRRLLVADSQANRIGRAIQKLRTEFRKPLAVPELAQAAGMSVSTFHAHFRTVTGTTPLRYQKELRLIEARSLLQDRRAAVAEAAYAVGYESPTHFSRDYSRKYGRPPRHAKGSR